MNRRRKSHSGSPRQEKSHRHHHSRSPVEANRSAPNERNWSDRRSFEDRRRGNFRGRFDRFRRPYVNRRYDNPSRPERHSTGGSGEEKSPSIRHFTMRRGPREGETPVCLREEFKNEFDDSSMLANIDNFTIEERKSSRNPASGKLLSERWSAAPTTTAKSPSAADSNRFDESHTRQFDRPPRFGFPRGRNFRRVPSFQPLPYRDIGFRPVETPYQRQQQDNMAMTAATDEKNLVHLVDPTQVPKGRSYFEHDSRSGDRGFRGSNMRRGGFQPRGSQRDFMSRDRNEDPRQFERPRSPRRFPDATGGNPWKHDMFEAIDKGEPTG